MQHRTDCPPLPRFALPSPGKGRLPEPEIKDSSERPLLPHSLSDWQHIPQFSLTHLFSFCSRIPPTGLVLSQCLLNGHPSKKCEILTFWVISRHTPLLPSDLAWPPGPHSSDSFSAAFLLSSWICHVLCRLVGPLVTRQILPLMF